MSDNKEEDTGSLLMKFVETIAISPQDARELVEQYADQVRRASPGATDADVRQLVTDKIIDRYSWMAATSGAVTSLPGIIPGIGTAASVLGGGMADVTACMKLQVDMTMCLAVAINGGLSNEDAKHMSYIIALFGTLEQMGSASATKLVSSAGVKMVRQYLTGPTLVLIKELFKKVGINFTQKAVAKAVPFGVGVIIGGTANYALTRYVGNVARDAFILDMSEAAAVPQPAE